MSGPSWHERLLGGFRKTSDRLIGNLAGLGLARLDDATLDEIEEALIASDLGPTTAARVRQRLAEGQFERNMEELGIRLVVAEEVARVLEPVAKKLEIEAFPRPQVILVIGVNGSGKTTTIAKLANLLMEQDYSVMLAAGDTFRAAAIGQLRTWAERIGVPIVSGAEGGDAAGIVFEAVKKATEIGTDVLIVDTAGRLQNKRELMDELAKIRRVLGRLNPAAPHDVVLVLDATTGQNALNQIEVFKEVAGVTGLVMTKLDGTARGGVLVAAAEKYGLPIHAIGVGEKVDDLRPFNAQEVARCEQDGVRVAAPIKRGAMSAQYFRPVQFVHDEQTDTIRCPAGETMYPKGKHTRNRAIRYRTAACQTCQIKQQCTPGYQRTITGSWIRARSIGWNVGFRRNLIL